MSPQRRTKRELTFPALGVLPRSFQLLPQRHTKDTLVTTAWVHAATHVLIDTLAHPDGLPLFLRAAYEGKVVVSSDWARESMFEGAAADVEDAAYQVKWAKEEEEMEAVVDRKGKRREREDDEDNDDRSVPG